MQAHLPTNAKLRTGCDAVVIPAERLAGGLSPLRALPFLSQPSRIAGIFCTLMTATVSLTFVCDSIVVAAGPALIRVCCFQSTDVDHLSLHVMVRALDTADKQDLRKLQLLKDELVSVLS